MKTPRQQKEHLLKLARIINKFIKKEGSGPTVREFQEQAELSSTSVSFGLLNQLRDAEFIKGKGRDIKMGPQYTQ